ncbi:deoxyguanosinetriphosphate triphosphohydrolase [Candidatus Margulisiibacteriota bacterium]
MLSREDFEKREDHILAPYAVRSMYSKGRVYPETGGGTRTDFEHDRDRIIHSRAFRRLKHKTQVFVAHEGDHYRTRLTHTLEVAQIARHLARLLAVNEDLAETIALAHDLGHTPFGHVGEQVLDKLVKEVGGFEHNQHSLRVVEVLEKKYPNFNGLNLTYEVLTGLKKHQTPWDVPNPPQDMEGPSIEAQCVNMADEVAYNNHDLDDGFEAGLFTLDDLRYVTLWQLAEKEVDKEYNNLSERELKNLTVRYLIGWQIRDIHETSLRNIEEAAIHLLTDVYTFRQKLVDYSQEMSAMNHEMRQFLIERFYKHPRVAGMNKQAELIIQTLYPYYLVNTQQVRDSLAHIFIETPIKRVVADYIAGMTDNFAEAEFTKIRDHDLQD